jgi:hypothetical protein
MQTPVVLEIKNVERQFSGFLTERALKCAISQFERLLTTSYRVSYCLFLAQTIAKRDGGCQLMTTQ